MTKAKRATRRAVAACLLILTNGAGCAYSHQIARFEASTAKPCDDIAALGQEEVDRRFHAIETYLNADVGARRAWLGIWTTLLGLGTVGQAVGAGIVDSHATRAALIGGAAATAAAATATVVFHPIPLSVDPELKSLPETTLEEKRARLCRAETMFYESAGREAEGTSMRGRILADLTGLAGGIVGIAFGDIATGLGTIAGSIGGYEVQMATRPSRTLAAWLDYVADPALPLASTIEVQVAPQNVSLAWHF